MQDMEISNFYPYWIYAFEYEQYVEFIKYLKSKKKKRKYLPHLGEWNTSDNDTVYLFRKRDKKHKYPSGFFGYCKLKNECIDNSDKEIKVFKDELNNKYCVEIKQISFMTKNEVMQIDDFISYFDMTKNSFYKRYIKKFLIAKNIAPEYSSIIMKHLYKKIKNEKNKLILDLEFILDDETCSESDDSSEETFMTSVSTKKSKKKIINDVSSNESSINKKPKKKINKDSSSDSYCSYSTNTTMTTATTETTADSNDDSGTYEPEPEDENKNGLIPIMLVPCNKFKLPKIDYDKKKFRPSKNPDIDAKHEYFINHLDKCLECEITNNNRQEFGRILRNEYLFLYSAYEKNIHEVFELEEGFNKYFNCKKYDVIGYDVDKINIKILHILDDKHLYSNCMMICCTLPPIES